MSDLQVKTMAQCLKEGIQFEVLFWVGCAGSFDDRAKKVTRSFVRLLNAANVCFAVLGEEERCTGDPARRAGNEFLFQMQAMTNIQTLNRYRVKKIVTTCPHCFNTLKNEYPDLGGTYQVIHHTEYLLQLLQEKRLKIEEGAFKGRRITFHDPCYLGRANGIYEAPRMLIGRLEAKLFEMKRCRKNSLCCGAGGAQMFKKPESGQKDINIERTEEAIKASPEFIATACPFCKTMLTDGLKHKEKDIPVMDIAELIVQTKDLS